MPIGFDPQVELTRIYTLRELMESCRQRVPVVLHQIDLMLDDPDLAPGDRIKLFDMIFNRGYGRPGQTVYHIQEEMVPTENRVKVYIPHNSRDNVSGKIIDAVPS